MAAFCSFAGLPLTHDASRSILATTTCQPPIYHMLRRQKQVRSVIPPSPAPESAPTIATQQQPSPTASSNKILAYVAAAVILAAAPFSSLHTPPPAVAGSINSAPLRFSQSLLQDDSEAPVKLQAQWDVKSINSQTETFLMFSNDSGSVVDLWWIDYFGHEVYYASINPGTTHMQPSYATHPWVVRDHISQNSVLVLVAGAQPALAVVESV